MEETLNAIRLIDFVVSLAAILVLLAVAMQSVGRRLVYVGAFTYLVHALFFELARLWSQGVAIDDSFFLYWAVALRLHATLMIVSYGVYFTRLAILKR